jgi:O-antigen ligase
MIELYRKETTAALTYPVRAASFLLLAFIVLVPVVVWNGTMTVLAGKLLLARWIILAVSVVLFFDYVKNRVMVIPDTALAALAATFVVYASVICFLRPYADWEILGDLCLSVLLFLEAIVLMKNAGYSRRLLLAWQISSIIVCAYFILQKAGFDFVVWQTRADWIGSTLSNRNLMVYFLICSFPYSAYLFLTEKGTVKWVAGFSLMLAIATLILCSSRVSIVILLLSFPAYLLYMRTKTPYPGIRKLLLVSALVLGMGVFAAAVGFLIYLCSMSFFELNGFSHARLLLWKDTLHLIKSDPWFGHGAGCFAKIFPEYRSTALGYLFVFFEPVFLSHNEFLEILAENGVIGLGLFAALIIRGTGIGTANRNRTPAQKTLLFFSSMSLFGCLVFSTIGEASHMFACSAFSWLSLAVCYSCNAKEPQARRIPKRMYAVITGGFILWCIFSLWLFQLFGRAFLADRYIKHASLRMNSASTMDTASNDLEKALRLQPSNKYALYQRAYISTAKGNFQDALRDYEKIRTTDPYFENIHYNIGVLYYLQKNYTKAIENLNVTLRIYPTFLTGIFYLAESYYLTGQFKQCGLWCDRFIELDPANEKARVLRNMAAQKTEDQWQK